MAKEKKGFSSEALNNLGTSEVVEQKEATGTEEETLVVRKKVSKTHTNISVSLTIAERNYFVKYLNDNNIDTKVSEIIRDLLREKGFLPSKY